MKPPQPIFGPLRDKLGVITRTFFAQRDFGDKSILVELYSSFKISKAIEENSKEEEREGQEMYMGEPASEADERRPSPRLTLVARTRRNFIEGVSVQVPDQDSDVAQVAAVAAQGGVSRFELALRRVLTCLLVAQVMFYSARDPVESLCTFQYSLVALVPGTLAPVPCFSRSDWTLISYAHLVQPFSCTSTTPPPLISMSGQVPSRNRHHYARPTRRA